MKRSIALGAGFLLAFAGMACGPSKSADNAPAPTGPTNDAGPGDTDAGPAADAGSTAELPKAVLCPETNFVTPTLPNSVYVGDVDLKADTTWTADKIYLINDDFKVINHTLTVEAGTTICLSGKGKIYVGEGIEPGEIHLQGTKEKPIVLTAFPSSQDPTKPDQFHGGIQFDTFMKSTLSNVNIWYGGPGGGGASPAFELTSSGHGTDGKPLLVDHLVFGAVQTRGIKVASPLGVADGSSIQFTGFVTPDGDTPALDAVAELEITAIKSFSKAFTFAGAPIPDAAKHVNLRISQAEGKIQQDTEVFDFGLPYVLRNQLVTQVVGAQDDPVGPTLTIHEGVTMKMSGAFIVGGTSGTAYGNLVVAGTAAKPVVFTSTEDAPAAGDWEGFYFPGGFYDPAKTKIDHAEILYAGVDGSNGQQINRSVSHCGTDSVGAVIITSSSASTGYPGPAITNTKIAHSKSNGIVGASGQGGYFCSTEYQGSTGNTFEDIAGQQVLVAACP